MAAILDQLKLGCVGNKSLDTFDELCTFPDLTRVEAAIDKKNLPVKAKKATLGLGLR